MARIRFAVLRDDFPEESGSEHKWSQFKSRIEHTIEKLGDELDKIGVDEAVIELDCDDTVLRKVKRGDYPYIDKMNSNRVRLTFRHPSLGVLQYPCGTYSDYRGNIRAIVLTLEALRAIERYGACGNGQQYEGFRELPGGEDQERYFVNAYEAAEYIAEIAGKSPASADAIVEDQEYRAFCYKLAAKKAHPDSGGSDEQFKTLQQAKDLIDSVEGDEPRAA